MKRIVTGSLLAATLLIPAVASAQGVPGGIERGSREGERAAGPVGGIVGGAIGAGGGYVIGNEHRKSVEKKRRAAYRAAYYRKHGHYPNAYVYQKKK